MLNNIRTTRLNKEYTQEECAKACEITLRYFINIEKGTQIPNVYLALKLSKFLNVDINYLFPLNKNQ